MHGGKGFGTGRRACPGPARRRVPPTGGYGRPAARFKPNPAGRLLLLILLLLPVLARPAAAQSAEPVVVTMLGDSITAGYGLPEQAAPPARLQAWLRQRGVPARVVDAGVSGDTTAGGLARLDWVLAEEPDLLIVALGANDALRGIDPAVARDNLDRILARAAQREIPVLLAGMLAPPNLGAEYAAAFNPIYAELAESHGVALYPFLLEGVAMRPELNQADGIHPNEEGAAALAERLGPAVLELVGGG